MANEHRGETAFTALGREMFLVYGNREVAEMQPALGFRRPDPLAPPRFEDVDSEVKVETEPGRWETRALTKRVVVDFAARHQRMLEAFEVCFLNPGPEDVRTMFRVGLGRWQRTAGEKLTEEQFDEVCDELGLAALKDLHFRAVSNSLRRGGPTEKGSADPNATGAEPAFSTSTAS